MSATAIVPLVGCVTNALLALLIYFGNPRQQINRLYALLGLCIAGWNLGQFHLFVAASRHEAIFWIHFEWIAIILGPVLLFHLSLIIAGKSLQRWQCNLLYTLSAAFVLLSLTPWMIADIHHLGAAGWYAKAGPGMYFFHPFFMALVAMSIIVLARSRRSASRLMRKKLDALILAQGLLLFSGINDVLPVMGHVNYPFTSTPVFPYGSLAAVLYGIIVGYSVLQNDLLNVHIALGRMAAQIVRFVFFVVIGACLLLLAAVLFPDDFGGVALLLAFLAMVGAGLCAALLFPKLFGSGPEEIEKSLLGDRFEYHDKIRAFTESLPGYALRKELLDDLAELLQSSLGVDAFRLYLESEQPETYELVLCQPLSGAPRSTLSPATLPVSLFTGKSAHSFHVASIWPGGDNDRSQRLRQTLQLFDMTVCLGLVSGGRALGALLLSDKRDKTPYTATDLALLESLADRMALVLNQFRLTNQILRNQEMELLGRMSKGIAHDLNNLLTPISTLLQLLEEGHDLKDISELLPPARRNIETARSYILNSLFLSKQNEPNLQPGDLTKAVQNALALQRANLDAAGISTSVKMPYSLHAMMDEAMMVRVFTNLIANAIDASSRGGIIEIEGAGFTPPGQHRRWLRVTVTDHGTGISEKVLAQIGKAYVTTKDTGDDRRGFGLGLPICKKIIEIHGGNLKIESKVGSGTRIIVDVPGDLPSPQNSQDTQT